MSHLFNLPVHFTTTVKGGVQRTIFEHPVPIFACHVQLTRRSPLFVVLRYVLKVCCSEDGSQSTYSNYSRFQVQLSLLSFNSTFLQRGLVLNKNNPSGISHFMRLSAVTPIDYCPMAQNQSKTKAQVDRRWFRAHKSAFGRAPLE